MEEINKLMKELLVNTFEVGTSCWVDITHINNPHSFYVRPRAYDMYMPIVQTHGDVMDASEINIGTVVLYKSKILKSFIRGKVITMTSGVKPACDLQAIDVGFVEKSVSLKRLWRPFHQVNLPSLATHCRLADCAPKGNVWNDEAINAMKTYVEGERAKIVIRSKTIDSLIVEIYNSCPDDIATLLALTGFTTFGYIPSDF